MLPLELTHPQWDPVALRLGPIQIHWYALMYLLGFALGYVLLVRRLRHQPYARITDPAPWTRQSVEDILLASILGVVVGGRLGYCLFYKPGYYASHPLEALFVWQGGMSFHGGAIGVAVALLVYAWRARRPFLEVTDLLVPAAPTGLAAGRLGNFINGELWGRPAPDSLPWAMVFPQAGAEARHPSQIYQFLLEGLLLAAILWWYARRERARGQVSGLFVLGYGLFRFIAEYFREPDAHLGVLGLGLSMGQWLCVPMIVGGALLWWLAKRADKHPSTPVSGDDAVEAALADEDPLAEPESDEAGKTSDADDSEENDGAEKVDESEAATDEAEESAEPEAPQESEPEADEPVVPAAPKPAGATRADQPDATDA